MSKYIGTPVVSLSTDTVDVTGDITTTDATPEVIIINDTHEDTDGGREGKLTFKGQASGGEETTLAQIQASHDGTSDDEKGDLIFKTNDGSDGASPTERLRLDSVGSLGLGTSIPASSAAGVYLTGGGATYSTSSTYRYDMVNSYFDTAASAWKYIGNGVATQIYQANGDIQFNDAVANSSGAGAALTWQENMVIKSDGKVGIGTSSPNQLLEVANSSGGATISISTDEAAGSTGSKKYNNLDFTGYNNTVLARIQSWDESSSTGHGYLTFHTFPSGGSLTERARIDNSGNVLVAKTVTDGSVVGHELRAMGQAIHTASGDVPVIARRMSNDGDVVLIQGQSGTVGFIGIKSSKMVLVSGSVGIGVGDDNAFPTSGSGASTDNTMDMGDSSARWQDVFAANGVTTTSDENEKQQITSLTSSEVTAAKAISKLFKTYKWNDAVTAKGDDARTHTGVIAQQVQTAMTDAGLDASKYGFWCSDTWWETHTEVAAVEADEENGIEAKDAYTDRYVYKTEDEAPEGATERTRLGIRYPELLAFIGAATEQRLTSIEARLTALEGE
jgi:hypothetical protein